MRLILFLVLSVSLVHAQDMWKDVYSEKAWSDRDRWQKAPELIRHLALSPGGRVADIGCHEGYMTVKLAAAVGSTGKVYAVDIEQSKLDRLDANLKQRNITNVIPIKGKEDDPLLPLALDAVIILDTYHEMDAHEQILQRIKQSLKPGGRLVLCEAIANSRKNASREEQEGKHELGLSFALEDIKKAGFTLVYQKEAFVDRTAEKGDIMWIIVVKK
jgi:precorrin-6B methylase 2